MNKKSAVVFSYWTDMIFPYIINCIYSFILREKIVWKNTNSAIQNGENWVYHVKMKNARYRKYIWRVQGKRGCVNYQFDASKCAFYNVHTKLHQTTLCRMHTFNFYSKWTLDIPSFPLDPSNNQRMLFSPHQWLKKNHIHIQILHFDSTFSEMYIISLLLPSNFRVPLVLNFVRWITFNKYCTYYIHICCNTCANILYCNYVSTHI